MARELDAILDHGEAHPAPSCANENGSASFLEQIIRPIYDTVREVSDFSCVLVFLCGIHFVYDTLSELDESINILSFIASTCYLVELGLRSNEIDRI